MAIGTSADIGIRVFLDDAASAGLNAINASLAVMAGFGAAFGIFGGVLVTSIKDAADFQTILIQMGRAGNLTQEQMAGLGQTLMDVGGHSIFSIEELGQAFVVLLQRGVSAADIMHGVGQQAVYLAEATGMQAVPAAQLLASVLVAFNIPATQAAQTVDLLQFLIEHGIGPSDSLASSLARMGAVASVLHLNLADIIPAFDLLSRATGSYSMATTSLYYYLNQVKFGTKTYRDEIQHLGLSFYDAQGNFIGLNQSLQLLYEKLKDKSPKEAAAILGSLFNIRSGQGIGILMQDMKQVYDLTHKLAQSHDNMGVALQRAKQAEDSAAGAWKGFSTNIKDVLTLMGGPFLTIIQPLLLHLRDLSTRLRQFMADNPQIASTFFGVATALSAIGLIVAVALSPIGAFVGIILAVIAGVALLAAGITFLVSKWQQIVAWLHPVIVMFQALFKAMNFGEGLKELKSAWDQLVQAITPILPLLKAIVLGLGLLVGGLILGVAVALIVLARAVMFVIEFLVLLIATILKDLTAAWMWLYNGARSALLGIESLFQNLPGKVGNALNQIAHFFMNLINSAGDWGANLINMFIAGIMRAVGGLFSAIGNIANKVKGFLGFHSPPKEGPLADSDSYMPNMVAMFSQGIKQSVPMLHNALTSAASSMSSVPQVSRMAQPTGTGVYPGSTGAYLQPITLMVDGKVLSQVVFNNLTGQLQLNGAGRAFR